MIKYFVDVDSNNEIIGYYNDDVHSAIPATAVEISKADWQTALEINANTLENGALVYIEPPVQVMANVDILSLRKIAYQSESDPLFMEWQFDNTPESEQIWRDKVAEIKLRYPLST